MPRYGKRAKRTSYRRKYSKKKAKPSKKLVKAVKNVINRIAETKVHYQSPLIAAPFSSTRSSGIWYGLQPLQNLTQGNGDFQRNGDQIFLKGFKVDFRIFINDTGYVPPYKFRVRFLVWRANIDTASIASPLFGTTYQPSIKAGAGIQQIIDREDHTVVHSSIHTSGVANNYLPVDLPTLEPTSLGDIAFSRYIKINKKVTFSGNNVTSLKTANYFIGFYVDMEPGLTAFNVGGTMTYRVFYTDM